MTVRVDSSGSLTGVSTVSAPDAPVGVTFLPDGSVSVAGIGILPALAAPQDGDVLVYNASSGTWSPSAPTAVLG